MTACGQTATTLQVGMQWSVARLPRGVPASAGRDSSSDGALVLVRRAPCDAVQVGLREPDVEQVTLAHRAEVVERRGGHPPPVESGLQPPRRGKETPGGGLHATGQ